MVPFIFLVLCISPLLKATRAQHNPVLTAEGDVVVAVFLPLTKGCFVENPSGVLYAEAIIYQLAQHSSIQKEHNSTLGYILFDTCESAEIAGKAASDLLRIMTRKTNQSDNEKHQSIVAVIIDAQNTPIVVAIKKKLSTYNLPQILINSRNMMNRQHAASDLFKLLHNPRVAVRATRTAGTPLFLKLQYTTCLDDDVIQPEVDAMINDMLKTSQDSNEQKWMSEMTIGLIVSRFEEAMAMIKKARKRTTTSNTTWLIITQELRSFYRVKGIQLNESIFVLTKTRPTVSPEQLKKFQNHLKNVNKKRKSRSLHSFLKDLSMFRNSHPCYINMPQLKLFEKKLNVLSEIFHTVSQFKLVLREMLSRNDSRQVMDATRLRNDLNAYVTDQGNFQRGQCNSSNTKCSSNEVQYTLSEMVLNNTCCSFNMIGNWTNSSSWKIDPTMIAFSQTKSTSRKCHMGYPVHLPTFLGDCLEHACRKCPKKDQLTYDGLGNASCELCTIGKCFKMDYVAFSRPFAMVITCLCVVGELLLILVVIIFTKFRKTPVVKSSNRMFNYLTLTTLGFWFALIPSFLRQPDHFTCNALVAFFPIMYATVSSIQLNKTVRLLLIFKSMQQPSKFLGNTSFFFITFAFILLQVVLSVLNFIKYPVHVVTRIQTDAVVLHCDHNFSPISALTFMYNCLLSAACGILAYRARKLPQNFNEAKNMSFAILSYTVSWTIVIIGYHDEKFADQQTAVVCFGFAIGGFLVLVCLFFPKLRVILFYPQLNTKSAMRESTRRYSVEVSVNISALRPPQRSRSSTFDCGYSVKPSYEHRRMSLTNSSSYGNEHKPINGYQYRPRAVSDTSFMKFVCEQTPRYNTRTNKDFFQLQNTTVDTRPMIRNSPTSSV